MDKKGQSPTQRTEVTNSDPESPRSLTIANQGIRTGSQFASLMSALMTDLIEGKITPGVGNAACNAGGKLLKVVEMQAKYGQTRNGSNEKVLQLTGGSERNGQ